MLARKNSKELGDCTMQPVDGSRKKPLHPILAELERVPIKAGPLRMQLCTKLDPEVIHRICTYIVIGGHPEIAAQACGIAVTTWEKWLLCGARLLKEGSWLPEEEIYVELVVRIHAAVAKSELRDIARIDAGARTDWRAARSKLQARHHERWAIPERKSRLVVEGNPENPVEVLHTAGYKPIDVDSLPLEACEAILAQFARQREAESLPALEHKPVALDDKKE
jgi:hypothetical protein